MYKIGDLVSVRKDLIIEKYYGNNVFVSGMKEYCGKTFSIGAAEKFGYYLQDCKSWVFTDEMLLPIHEGEIVQIVTSIPYEKCGIPDENWKTLLGVKAKILYRAEASYYRCQILEGVLKNVTLDFLPSHIIKIQNLTREIVHETQKAPSESFIISEQQNILTAIEVNVVCCKKETYTI